MEENNKKRFKCRRIKQAMTKWSFFYLKFIIIVILSECHLRSVVSSSYNKNNYDFGFLSSKTNLKNGSPIFTVMTFWNFFDNWNSKTFASLKRNNRIIQQAVGYLDLFCFFYFTSVYVPSYLQLLSLCHKIQLYKENSETNSSTRKTL